MKKQFLLLVATVFTAFASFAQEQITNGSFETWVDSTAPTGWATYATFEGPNYTALARKVPAAAQIGGHSAATNGNFSLAVFTHTALDTANNPIGSFPGLVMLGDSARGQAFTSTPDSLTFDYLYLPASANDSAVISAYFRAADNSPINGFLPETFGSTVVGTDTQWVHVSLPIFVDWDSTDAPATLHFSIESSTDTTVAAAGAILLVDNIVFVYNSSPTSIADVKTLNSIKLYPNPASSVVNIEVSAEVDAQNITIIDMKGRAVKTVNNVTGTSSLNIDNLANGNYAVQFSNAKTNAFTGTKLLIKK